MWFLPYWPYSGSSSSCISHCLLLVQKKSHFTFSQILPKSLKQMSTLLILLFFFFFTVMLVLSSNDGSLIHSRTILYFFFYYFRSLGSTILNNSIEIKYLWFFLMVEWICLKFFHEAYVYRIFWGCSQLSNYTYYFIFQNFKCFSHGFWIL